MNSKLLPLSQKNVMTILIIAGVTLLIIFFAVKNPSVNTPPPPPTRVVYPTEKLPRTAMIYFLPENLQVKSNNTYSADIYVSTGNSQITGVQTEIEYDPSRFESLTLSPPQESLFGPSQTVLFNKQDTRAGKISYAIAILPNGTPVSGDGKIATVTFRLRNTNAKDTKIYFVKNTVVAVEGETQSILKRVVPLTLSIIQ